MDLKTSLDALTMETAVLGGAVLGCGGGGKLEDGLYLGESAAAHGEARLIAPSLLSDEAIVAAVMPLHTSGVDTHQIHPTQAYRAVEMLQEAVGAAVTGLVNGGLGAVESMIGWEMSGAGRIPLIDGGIPASYHPVSLRNLFEFWQETAPLETFTVSLAAHPQNGRGRQERLWQAQPRDLLRELAAIPKSESESLVAVAGPLAPAALHARGSTSPVSRALQVGRALLAVSEQGGKASAAALHAILSCRFSTFATVTAIHWHGQGLDGYGHIEMRDVANRHLQLTYGQRYLALSGDGQTIAAFPDLIVTLGILGTPLTGEEVFMGQDLYLLVGSQMNA